MKKESIKYKSKVVKKPIKTPKVVEKPKVIKKTAPPPPESEFDSSEDEEWDTVAMYEAYLAK